jgi:muconolactone delta-isomerase
MPEYLVKFNVEAKVPMPEQGMASFFKEYIEPSFKMFAKLKKEGVILGGGMPPGSKQMWLLLKANDCDQLDSMLLKVPMWPVAQVMVTPLADMEQRYQTVAPRFSTDT